MTGEVCAGPACRQECHVDRGGCALVESLLMAGTRSSAVKNAPTSFRCSGLFDIHSDLS